MNRIQQITSETFARFHSLIRLWVFVKLFIRIWQFM